MAKKKARNLSMTPQAVPAPSSDPLDSIALSKDQIRKILFTAGAKIVAGNLPIINRLLAVTETISQEVREEKLKTLLTKFQLDFDSVNQAVDKLKGIFGSRAGFILFQKLVQILDSGVADEQWIALLAKTLKHMSNTEIETHFDELAYVLAQIGRLSPQALIVLSRYDDWRSLAVSGTTTMSMFTVAGDWDKQAAKHLAGVLGVTDDSYKARIVHAFRDLESAGMVRLGESKRIDQTDVGKEMYKYIS